MCDEYIRKERKDMFRIYWAIATRKVFTGRVRALQQEKEEREDRLEDEKPPD